MSGPPPTTLLNFDLPKPLECDKVAKQFRLRSPPKGRYHAFDALCLTVCDGYVISSPNMSYIPTYIFGQAVLRPRLDGHWGYIEPFQMPQAFSKDFPWSCVIPLQGTIIEKDVQEDQWVVWYNMTDKDMTLESDDQPHVGRLKQHIIETMLRCEAYLIGRVDVYANLKHRGRHSDTVNGLVQALRRNIHTLQQIPMVYSDLHLVFADFQCCFLDLYAKFKFELEVKDRPDLVQDGDHYDVHCNWMGVFTNKTKIALALWQAGMPVWHIRTSDQVPKDIHVGSITSIWWNPTIKTSILDDNPLPAIHTGFPRQARAHLCRPVGFVNIRGAALKEESLAAWRTRSLAVPASVPDSSALPIVQIIQAEPLFHTRREPQRVVESMTTEVIVKILEHVVRDVEKAVTPSLTARITRLEQSRSPPYVPPAATRNQDLSWDEPVSSLLPKIDPVWDAALSRVNPRPPTTSALIWNGFPFPDLLLFARVQGDDRRNRYITNWLIIRHQWTQSVAQGRVRPPSAKNWREILNGLPQFITETDYGAPAYASYRQLDWLLPPPFLDQSTFQPSTSSKVARAAKKTRDQRQTALDFLGTWQGPLFQTLQREVPKALHYHEESIPIEQFPDVSDALLKQVIWEINELCFRFELQLLDRHFTAGHRRSTAEKFESHDNMIASVFDTGSLLAIANHRLPCQPQYLVSNISMIHRAFVEIFCIILSSWPGFPSPLQDAMPAVDVDFIPRENQLLDFYLCTASQFLGRRPSVPRIPV